MKLPKDTWVVLAEEDFRTLTYHIYLFKYDSETGERAVYDGNTMRTVPEGSEMPLWFTASRQVIEQTGFLNAFKHVYTVRQVLERFT